MRRIYHPYYRWEEYEAGMWRSVHGADRREMLSKAIDFTGDAELYGRWMLRVIEEWPISCEHNLTATEMNRLAWIGHAACCMAIECPEDITRAAWALLSQQQQDEANAKAQAAVDQWATHHNETQNPQIPLDLGDAGLSERDTGRGRPAAGSAQQGAILSADLPRDHAERCLAE